MTTLERAALAKAVEVQKRCYRFLQLIKNDRLPLAGGWAIGNPHHDSSTEAERFRELVLAHFLDLPEDSRPLSSAEGDLADFANFFVSYLFCSFDLVENPRLLQIDQTASDAALCWCELCARLTKAPDLKLKKITVRDKAAADSLEAEALRQLASGAGLELSAEDFQSLLKAPKLTAARALVAYGIELVRRCRGEEVDASSLALWRRFAWTSGAPKKDFVLTPDVIEAAEKDLIAEAKTLKRG